jgi:virginiamycin B lyase
VGGRNTGAAGGAGTSGAAGSTGSAGAPGTGGTWPPALKEFPLSHSDAAACNLVAGPDGNIWFAEYHRSNIGRITPAGVITEFPTPKISSGPCEMTVGSDGALWYIEVAGIGRVTVAGSFTEYPTTYRPRSITAGPDGNLWFIEGTDVNDVDANAIAAMSVAGTIVAEYPIPTANADATSITTGPDGNLWFTEEYFTANQLGRLTPAGVFTEFPLPIAEVQSDWIIAGLGQTLLYSESEFMPNIQDWVGQITTGGAYSQTLVPTIQGGVARLAVGPDGNIWFTQYLGNNVYRMTPSGTLSLAFNRNATYPQDIVGGPDGNIWFVESYTGVIARLTL